MKTPLRPTLFAALLAASPAIRAEKAGTRPLLILDRASVAESEGVTFELEQAKKCPENPILSPGTGDQWDGLQVAWPGTVLYEPQTGMFRCWYSGLNAVQDRRPKNAHLPWETGYAESRDGIHWLKPDVRGAGDSRIALNENPVPLINTVWANPDKSDGQRKFLCLWLEKNKNTDKYNKILASSPDGKRWKREKIAFESDNPTWPSFQDICQIVYRPEEKDPQYAVIAYSQIDRPRSWDGRTVRQIGYAHGPAVDRLVQTGEQIAVAPVKGIDEELHFASVRKFGETYVMLFESDLFSLARPKTAFHLAVSQDGRHFRRVHPHHAVIASGPVGTWDENVLVTTTSAMQMVGDEIWIFYFGTPGTFTRWPAQYAKSPDLRGSLFYETWLGLAVLPRDRLGCAVGPGSLTTNSIPAGSLWANFTGPAPRLWAVDADGKTLAVGKVTTHRSQTVYRQVEWSAAFPPGPCRVRVALPPGSRLYSLKY